MVMRMDSVLEVLTLESDQVRRMALSCISYVIVGKTLNPSEAAFRHLQHGPQNTSLALPVWLSG